MRINKESKIECPGCKLENKFQFRQPGFMQTTVSEYKCVHCESIIMVKLQRAADPNQVKNWSRVKFASQMLIDTLIELQKEGKAVATN
jgi:DNA-directed RNA polymerase subunit RPC12/RpoP